MSRGGSGDEDPALGQGLRIPAPQPREPRVWLSIQRSEAGLGGEGAALPVRPLARSLTSLSLRSPICKRGAILLAFQGCCEGWEEG